MLELADKPVQELIEIANGGTYYNPVYGRKHWYSIFKTCLKGSKREYNLENQLAAIEALGNTESQEALEFLRSLLQMDSSSERCTDNGIMIGSDVYYSLDATFSFPNARGQLATHLKYRLDEGNEMNPYIITEGDHQTVQSRIRGHRVIKNAIKKLEQCLS